MRTYRIAAIPGDGIGTEVIAAGVEALTACAQRHGGFAITFAGARNATRKPVRSCRRTAAT
jgi:isocitrate/isopropylmalate dehydrogenase